MLRKLIRYDMRSMGRFLWFIYLAVLAVAVILGLSIHGAASAVSNSPSYMGASGDLVSSSVGMGILLAVYTLLLLAMFIITVVMIIIRFYRNMLGGEGYLMHTLPVPSWMLIVSKLFVGFIFELIALGVSILSLGLMMLSSRSAKEIMQAIGVHISDLGEYKTIIVLLLITLLVSMVYTILLFYVSLAIGNLNNKHKILVAVAAFIGITIAVNIISGLLNINSFATMFVVAGYPDSGMSVFQALLIKQIILDAACAVGCFVGTNWIMNNRLNLA